MELEQQVSTLLVGSSNLSSGAKDNHYELFILTNFRVRITMVNGILWFIGLVVVVLVLVTCLAGDGHLG